MKFKRTKLNTIRFSINREEQWEEFFREVDTDYFFVHSSAHIWDSVPKSAGEIGVICSHAGGRKQAYRVEDCAVFEICLNPFAVEPPEMQKEFKFSTSELVDE